MTNAEQDQIAHLAEKAIDGSLSQLEASELEDMVSRDSDAMSLYADLMSAHAALTLSCGGTGIGPVSDADAKLNSLPESNREQPRPESRLKKYLATGLIVALAACLAVAVDWQRSNEAPYIAEIVDAAEAVWGECSVPTSLGSRVSAGFVSLEQGYVTFRFTSGALVTLESPARLEIRSSMSAHLNHGTVIADIPDSAHGFAIYTENAVAIDHGTEFAVAVSRDGGEAAIEVIAGEVEVRHSSTDESLHLKTRERVSSNESGFQKTSIASAEMGMRQWVASGSPTGEDLIRISSSIGFGRDATLSRGRHWSEGLETDSLILVKTASPGYSQFDRLGLVAFDLSSLDGTDDHFTRASLQLSLRASGIGYASKVPDCGFVVYGAVDESLDSWVERQSPAWQEFDEVDGAENTRFLPGFSEIGRFTVRRGQQSGVVSIGGKALADFVRNDSNGLATFMIARETPELSAGGLVHAFSSGRHPSGVAPTLTVYFEER